MSWIKACSENAPRVETFLRRNEAFCIHLCESYIKNAGTLLQKGGFLIHMRGSEVQSIIGTDLKGHVYPYFSRAPEEYEKKMISGYLRSAGRIISVMGESSSVNILSRLVPGTLYRQIDYNLMKEEGAYTPSKQSYLKTQQMTLKDIPRVYPLQEGYEKEEVLLNPGNFNRGASLLLFQKRVKNYPHYIGLDGKEIVTMARINAMSWNIFQIGGVYTLPQVRGRGFAEEMMAFTLKEIHRKGRTGLLFVKRTNKAALKLYEKMKFDTISSFSIAYFS